MNEPPGIQVSIKDELKKNLIFGIEARLPIGIILGFYGFRHQVMQLMQCLSHGTRAYIVNADGLPGFVLKFDIIPFLREADEAGQLENAKKYQVIDLSTVESELEKFAWYEEKIVEGEQINLTNIKKKMDFLSEEYPSLFIFILEFFDMTDKIEQYMNKCKTYEEDPYKYSLYVHGYFLVWLDQ